MKVIAYARISVSREESVSIERQLQACRDTCIARDWTLLAEYRDDGISATANKPEDRLGWRQVLDHPGEIDAVLVWKVDRLARRVLDFLHADEALRARGAGVVCVDDPIDMTTPQGRAFAIMLAVFAEMEAEAIRSRVTAAKRALIRAGRVSGGAAPYGYRNAPNPDGAGKVLAKDPERIPFVLEAAHRVQRGDSVYSVAKWLNESGAPPKGRRNETGWTVTVVRRLLENPALAGMTPYNPGNTGKQRGSEVLRGPDGLPVIRDDIAIMTTEDRRTLLGCLADTDRPRAAAGMSSPLLSGLVWCSRCDRKMYRNSKNLGAKRVHFYRCEGCNATARNLDTHVVDLLISTRGSEHVLESIDQAPAEDRVRLADLEAAIDDTTARMRDDDADMVLLAERLTALKAQRQKARSGSETQRTFQVTGKRLETAWTAAGNDVVAQRALLTGKIARVLLAPAGGRTGRKFDKGRVTLVPRPETEMEKTLARIFPGMA